MRPKELKPMTAPKREVPYGSSTWTVLPRKGLLPVHRALSARTDHPFQLILPFTARCPTQLFLRQTNISVFILPDSLY